MAGLARRMLPAPARRAVRRLLPPRYRTAWPEELVMSDLLAAGDVALDVGANIGVFTVTMARLVGSRGTVHAFEPNPNTAALLRARLAAADVRNCAVVEAAVSDEPGGFAELRLDERAGMHGVASTIIAGESVGGAPAGPVVKVQAIRLDDYCREHSVVPAFVKMDIEGAEPLALRGFAGVMKASRPHLLVEMSSSGDSSNRTLHVLREAGYRLYDATSYEAVDPDLYAARALIRNVIAIHESRLGRTPYAGLSRVPAARREPSDLEFEDCEGETLRRSSLRLGRGRYVASFDFASEGSPELELAVLSAPGRALAASAAAAGSVHLSRDLVFELLRGGTVSLSLRRLSEAGRVTLKSISVYRLALGR